LNILQIQNAQALRLSDKIVTVYNNMDGHCIFQDRTGKELWLWRR
jgi:hypothetical protein